MSDQTWVCEDCHRSTSGSCWRHFAHERSAGAAPLDAAKILLVLSEWDGVLDVGDDRQRFVEYLVDRLGTDR